MASHSDDDDFIKMIMDAEALWNTAIQGEDPM